MTRDIRFASFIRFSRSVRLTSRLRYFSTISDAIGATYAAPMASLMVEKYLCGEVKRTDLEKRMKEANLMSRVKKE